jgi:putative ABC transport system ATP-binding protein
MENSIEVNKQNENSNVIIEVNDVKKVYKIGNESVKALDGVSFTINKGEFCCLLGTSGSRKINFT